MIDVLFTLGIVVGILLIGYLLLSILRPEKF